MKVISLEISKRGPYESEYPNEMVGTVQITGNTGKMEVRLTPRTLSEIFRLCKKDVQRVADFNASQATSAVDEVADTIEMQIENNELMQIQGG